ncbi:MAG TPA: nucleotidyltransferase domain-containing protein, partial [Thermoleophilaceae bacterium]|nr:nucleotidyltransferase domain-containing protein [Thermoleophilaceae bacterium]
MPGTVAVVLGGSRATGTHRPGSDWDLGLFYRGSVEPVDPQAIERLGHEGHVSELGEWGPFMNGGAWLTVSDIPVDVLFRDLDTVEHWMQEAQHGRFEILTQNGYLAGAPTYLFAAEAAGAIQIHGSVRSFQFPDA